MNPDHSVNLDFKQDSSLSDMDSSGLDSHLSKKRKSSTGVYDAESNKKLLKKQSNTTSMTTAKSHVVSAPVSKRRKKGARLSQSRASAQGLEDSDNSLLFCICRKPYDENKFYIQCDECDDWFHGSCIKISEAESDAIDKWYCATCVARTGINSVWKPKCARSGCKKHIRLDSSYCSDACGIMVATKFLKSKISSLTPLSARANDPRATLQSDKHHEDIKRRLQVSRRILQVKSMIRALEMRQALIDDATERAYLYNRDWAASQNVVSSTNGRNDRAGAKKVCGFDERIVDLWVADLDSDSMQNIFNEPRLEKYTTEIEQVDTTNTSMPLDSSKAVSADASVPVAPLTSRYLCPTMCLCEGRCLCHDGWEFCKPREVELELDEQLAYLQTLRLERAAIDVRLRHYPLK
ncbi:JmjC domain-containing histone demethylation protein 1 [Batrachochytrium dendrobatidis]|nr:JmjC domain-containing histone demethylation protein 1 [Batrachochytrium dendrobatidis]KAK5665533.1 JmjC domain-containing histone demethylation protein 1 [Batrachochytrium dendrobatidis]